MCFTESKASSQLNTLTWEQRGQKIAKQCCWYFFKGKWLVTHDQYIFLFCCLYGQHSKRVFFIPEGYNDATLFHLKQKFFYLVIMQSDTDSALDLKNNIFISKKRKTRQEAAILSFCLKQLWALQTGIDFCSFDY